MYIYLIEQNGVFFYEGNKLVVVEIVETSLLLPSTLQNVINVMLVSSWAVAVL